MKEYKDCYVAFLDILGFKNMINNKSCSELFEVFESIKASSHTFVNLNDKDMETFKHIEYTIMSDSVVVYIDANLDDALFALLCTCQTIQMDLLNNGILMRGGIARGTLFREEYVIFGKGLSNAYLLESNIASFPRIVFNRELLNDGNEHNVGIPQDAWHYILIAQDDDELYYINPVAFARVISFVDGQENAPEYFDKALVVCQNVLDSACENSVRQKYLWLKNKIIKEIQKNRQCLDKDCKGTEMLVRWRL